MERPRAAIGWGPWMAGLPGGRPAAWRVASGAQFALIVSGSLPKHTESGAEMVTATGVRILKCGGGCLLRLNRAYATRSVGRR